MSLCEVFSLDVTLSTYFFAVNMLGILIFSRLLVFPELKAQFLRLSFKNRSVRSCCSRCALRVRPLSTGRDLNNDALLLHEVGLADGGHVMVTVSPGQNSYSDPPLHVRAALDAASPALLLAHRVSCPLRQPTRVHSCLSMRPHFQSCKPKVWLGTTV
jgi:hypothetical protein